MSHLVKFWQDVTNAQNRRINVQEPFSLTYVALLFITNYLICHDVFMLIGLNHDYLFDFILFLNLLKFHLHEENESIEV